jgi:hypothetical protein
MLYKEDIIKAVEMARKEEKEKAISAFSKVLSECGGCDCKDACSVKCGNDCLIEKFTELIK